MTSEKHYQSTILKARRAAISVNSNWKKSKAIDNDSCPIEVIDFFCGCGGVSAGFRSINGVNKTYRLLGGVDIDLDSRKTYEANINVPAFNADVSSLAKSKTALQNLMKCTGRRKSKPLVVIGCSPCQGFSSHRNASGQTDLRNSLFLDFVKIAVELRPDAIVIENVPELLTDNYWHLIQNARIQLEKKGFFVYVGFHNLASFGVPQQRFRALLLAMRKPFVSPEGFLRPNKFKTVRNAIGDLPILESGDHCNVDSMHRGVKHKPSTIETISFVPRDGGNLPLGKGPPCLMRAFEKLGKRVYEDVYGRLPWDKPSITITSHARNPASGRFVHPEQNRGLSVREAALLQGFPKNFIFEGTVDSKFRQVGNAVPPPFSAYVASLIADSLNSEPSISPEEFDSGAREPVGSSFTRLIPSIKSRGGILLKTGTSNPLK